LGVGRHDHCDPSRGDLYRAQQSATPDEFRPLLRDLFELTTQTITVTLPQKPARAGGHNHLVRPRLTV
jgi:hypothetical protein